MLAIYALERPKHVKLLITRVRFPSTNGVPLACMARLKQPGIKVLLHRFRSCGTPMAQASSCPGPYRPTNCWRVSERC